MSTSECRFKFHEQIDNIVPKTLDEIEKEILLQKKKNKLFKLQLKHKYLVNKDDGSISKCYKKRKYPPFPTRPIRDTGNYNLIESKKYSLDIDDVTIIVLASCSLTATVITIILT